MSDYSTPAPGTPVCTPDGVGIMDGVTGSLYAVAYPDGIAAIGMAAGSVMGYQPADVRPITDAQPEPVALPAYSFYVGSAAFYDGHTGSHAAYAIPAALRIDAHDARIKVWGMWDGEVEEVAIYELRLPDDATAQRIAYAMALGTGNESILVTRDATQSDCDRAMTSTARYRVTAESVLDGNRTLTHNPATYDTTKHTPASWGPGYRFEPDPRGDEVAFLVWADASVSPIAS